MKRLRIIILALFSTLILHASSVDSIAIRHVESLLAQARDASLEMDIKSSVGYSVKALQNARIIDYQFGILRSYYYIGQMLFYDGELNESLKYLTLGEKLKIAKEHPNLLSQIYKVKGTIYVSLEFKNKAKNEFNKAISYAQKISDINNSKFVQSQIYENMHHLFDKETESESIFLYLNKNRTLLESLPEDMAYPHLVNNYTSLGYSYFVNNKFIQAEEVLLDALDVANKYNYSYVSRTQMHLGDLYKALNNNDESLVYYKTSLHNLEEKRLESQFPAIYTRLAEIYRTLNNKDSADYYFNKLIMSENNLSKSKIETSSNVLDLLVEEEMYQEKQRRVRTIVSMSVILLIATSAIVVYIIVNNRKQREIIRHNDIIKQNIEFEDKSFELRDMARQNNPEFMKRFKDTYPVFYNNLIDSHKELSDGDLNLCILTYLQLDSKEIAEISYITLRTVQTRRSRLRKKINLPSDVDLYAYLKSI